MTTRDYARILRRSWWLIVVATVFGMLLAWAMSVSAKPVYSATSVAFVASETGGTLNELTQGNAFTERRVSTYANLVTEPIVTAAVIEDFGLDISPAAFAANVSVSIPVDTTLLEVTVADTSPEIAAGVANALITNLAAVVAEIETTSIPSGPVAADGTALQAAPPVKITQVRFADPPTSPVSPNIPLNVFIGLLVGLAIGTLAAILREVIDTRVRSLEDIEAVSVAPIVGAVPQFAKNRRGPVAMDEDVGSPTAESYRILRTNLQFLDLDGPATFVITSPHSSDGKSTIAVNLATSIAANGVRVLVVEADLRRPRVHEYLGVLGSAGLTDVLIGRASLTDVVQQGASPNLHILASGRIPPNPSELLGSQSMQELMAALQEMYDVVLYDTPPVLPVPDAAILSRHVGGVLLVVSIDHTRRDDIRSAVASLNKVNARIAGVVANRVAARGSTSYLNDSYVSIDPHGEAPRSAFAAPDDRERPNTQAPSGPYEPPVESGPREVSDEVLLSPGSRAANQAGWRTRQRALIEDRNDALP